MLREIKSKAIGKTATLYTADCSFEFRYKLLVGKYPWNPHKGKTLLLEISK